jgi:hypothetical protein
MEMMLGWRSTVWYLGLFWIGSAKGGKAGEGLAIGQSLFLFRLWSSAAETRQEDYPACFSKDVCYSRRQRGKDRNKNIKINNYTILHYTLGWCIEGTLFLAIAEPEQGRNPGSITERDICIAFGGMNEDLVVIIDKYILVVRYI